MSPSALLILAEGAEEMEAVITADVLRRAGIEVTVAGLNGPGPVKCSRNIGIVPDAALADVKGSTFDIIILPGGLGGTNALRASQSVKELLQAQEKSGKLIGAICAAPAALKEHGIAVGKNLTSHPCMAKEFTDGTYTYHEDRVVEDGTLITSRGPGTAFEFALAIATRLVGKEKVAEISPGMILPK